jgi:hypothetical protein
MTIHDTVHFTEDHHFPSHHFTTLYYISLPIFHFPALLDVSSPPFHNPSLPFTYAFLTSFLKKCDVQQKLVIASNIITPVIRTKTRSAFAIPTGEALCNRDVSYVKIVRFAQDP